MRRRDEARRRRARLAGEGLAADLAHHVARLAGAAEDAGAGHVFFDGKAARLELRCGAVEQALRLRLERLARRAFETEIDEALTLPIEHALAHFGFLRRRLKFARLAFLSSPRKRGPSNH